MKALGLRAASILLFVAAVAVFCLAFTQFGDETPPSRPSEVAQYEKAMLRHAQVAIVLGLVGSFVLLGAFACHARASAAKPSDPQP